MTKPLVISDLKKNRTEQHLKLLLKNVQHSIIDLVNKELNNGDKITIGKPRKCDIDYHVIGDISRIARIPNTWHPRRKRYSIPIYNQDFDYTFDEILNLSKEQRHGIEVFGVNEIDLLDYDKDINLDINIEYELNDIKDINIDTSSTLSLLPLFIQNLLTGREDGHRARYLTQMAMKIRGFPKTMAEQICKEHWSVKKFHHAVYGHGYNSFDYIWSRNDLFFPNWKTLEEEGWKIPKEDYDYKLMYNR